jgi:uncharacterized membrane protein
MTLFQMCSASLDAVSFGMTALAGALYMRGADTRHSFSSGMHTALTVCLFSLATSRINLILLTLLPAALYSKRRSPQYLISGAAAFLSALAWLGTVLATVRGGHGNEPPLSSTIIEYYLHHVGSFISVLYATVTNGDLLQFYWDMFIGLFGWSGIELPVTGPAKVWGIFLDPFVYIAFGVLLPALTYLTAQRDVARLLSKPSLLLTIAAALSLFLIFPILLVVWTPHPARVIQGVQGRYFTPILILLSFSVLNGKLTHASRTTCMTIVFIIATLSVSDMAPQLLRQYWWN